MFVVAYLHMKYFVFSSSACNLCCDYCGSTPENLEMPAKPEFSAKMLAEEIAPDPNPVIIFYGGEPMLNIPFMQQLIDLIPNADFVLQTNCTLLHLLPTPYLLKFKAILASIDGREETVKSYRGPNVYNKIVQNLQDVRNRGFVGHIVARMACSIQTDIYKDVMFLLSHELKFDSVYWQLDAQWDYPMNIRWGDFEKYLYDSYTPGVQSLFDQFMQSARTSNNDVTKFLQISPFTGIMRDMIRGIETKLRCSMGHDAISITTNGRLISCPVATTEDWNCVGILGKDKLQQVVSKNELGGQCLSCDIAGQCGGRCLYANKTQLWGPEGFDIVCGTVRQLVNLCRSGLEEIKDLIQRGIVDMSWFDFPNEHYSIETIP